MERTVEEIILQRRLQMIVHSYIYYELNENIVSDAVWGRWAHELVALQKQYPEASKKVKFYELFKDFQGDTGFDLAKSADKRAISKAHYLLSIRRKRKG